MLGEIQARLENFYPGKVKTINLPLDIDAVFSAERSQYYSTKLLAQALPFSTQYPGYIIILVDFDLYIPVLTYVFGEAMLRGNISIVSLCRLHEEFYTGSTDDSLLLKRAMKEVLHELGHNFGLYHCQNWECVMHSSSGIEEVDIKGDYFCASCQKLINEPTENN
ncbi:MAG: archaemetzincin [Ignavibacteria bacterium]|nr:archaemetzincin [Ignavibacteria bacterium]